MFNWLITSAGSFQTLQAGTVQSSSDTEAAFDWIPVSYNPVEAPVAISQIQTHTGGDWVKTRHRNLSPNGFQVRMEEDGQDTGHNQETIGWLTLPSGSGTLGGLAYEAMVTPAEVTHEPYDIAFSTRFPSNIPALFGAMSTFNGGDPAHLRQFSPVSARGAQIFVEEDTCSDAEQAHAPEGVSLLVIQPTYTAQSSPQAPADCSGLDGYNEECPQLTEWHASIDMSAYVGTAVCNVVVSTGGGTCADYCASQGGVCRHAQDNAGSGCELDPAHDRQNTEQNGCLQTWGDQICGCSGASGGNRPPPPPPRPPPPPAPTGGGGDAFVTPVATVVGTDTAGAGWTTFRLSLALGPKAADVYTIYGDSGTPEGAGGTTLVMPPAYQVAAPFGADLGGTNPQFWAIQAESQWDSWVTVGVTEGNNGEISSIGLDFLSWTEKAGTELVGRDSAVFWMDPDSGPSSGPVVIAQLTMPSSAAWDPAPTVAAQGRSTDGEGHDWDQLHIAWARPNGGGGGPGGGH